MLTKEVITTRIFTIHLPNCKGTMTKAEALVLLDELCDELSIEVEPVQSTLDENFEGDGEAIEEDAELPGAQN